MEFLDFIQDGFVTYFTVDGEAQQIPVYQRCVNVSGVDFSWIAAIDIDEFIVIEDEEAKTKPHGEQLKSILEDFRFQPGTTHGASRRLMHAELPNMFTLHTVFLNWQSASDN